MATEPTAEMFRSHIGTPFSIDVERGEPLELVLDEVTVHPSGRGPRQQPFSLVFTGASDRLATQGNFQLRHPALGDLLLFMVPIGPGRYEVVFN